MKFMKWLEHVARMKMSDVNRSKTVITTAMNTNIRTYICGFPTICILRD
jgi:hypothetical protein